MARRIFYLQSKFMKRIDTIDDRGFALCGIIFMIDFRAGGPSAI
ncbi:hypothetical protein CHCC20372_1463 [Bacillus paralicheniformis]|nr:hypothetical protein CHCC20372_1463 [Bacillus paralicheniformis]TWK88286.1 hypothetical protein CHCC20333_3415 [Bacillus paralicheniformis]